MAMMRTIPQEYPKRGSATGLKALSGPTWRETTSKPFAEAGLPDKAKGGALYCAKSLFATTIAIGKSGWNHGS
jgi:hypothetical protein